MGMGKTLQVIALLWTLLKQGPRGTPMVKKAVIACPASLVSNWGAEMKKWLGQTRLAPLLVEGGDKDAKSLFDDWALAHQKQYAVLVTSYETLRSYASKIESGGVDLLVCDEAHRLKNAKGDTLTVAALRALKCKRRVLLSGTPIQNDLTEYFGLMDFACPGLLGDLGTFKKIFSGPIERSRDKRASADERTIGAARGEELARMTREYVHRASASEVNARHGLPPKTEYVVFVRLSPTQAALYGALLKTAAVRGALGGKGSPLTALQKLQRLCNSARLLASGGGGGGGGGGGDVVDENDAEEDIRALRARVPRGYDDPFDATADALSPSFSGKLAVLLTMLRATTPGLDKTVVVSGFTSTLDLIAAALSAAGVGGKVSSRLDGSVAPNLRGAIVNKFNDGKGGDVFLLSCKAGGVGLNLVGANRLVLFDSDWNPANDLQALARVWREGQKRPVTIYRLVSTGTVEERVFQRQILKGDVADAMGMASVNKRGGDGGGGGGGGAGKISLSKEELRDLFRFDERTVCNTVEVLRTGGGGDGKGKTRELPKHWRECASAADGGIPDPPLASAMALTHARPGDDGGGGGGATGGDPGMRVVSFVARMPSSAESAATVDAESGSRKAEDEAAATA
jgi:SNF2 family DNA or RNA helicase